MKVTRAQRNAGRYKHVVTVLRARTAGGTSTAGQAIDHFEAIGDYRAFIEKINGEEYFAGFGIQTVDNYYVELRFIKGLTQHDRLQFINPNGRTVELDIVVVNDEREEGRFMRLLAVERGTSLPTITKPKLLPKVTSNIIEDAHKDRIVITFDKDMTVKDETRALDFLIVQINGKTETPRSMIFTPTAPRQLILLMTNDFKHGDVVQWHYKQSSWIMTKNTDIELGQQQHLVTNMVQGTAPTIPAPHVITSIIHAAHPKDIIVTYNEPMQGTPTEIIKAINTLIAGGNNVPFHPTSMQFDANNAAIMTFTYAQPFKYGDAVSWAYNDAHPTADLRNMANKKAENQSYAVHNEVAAPVQKALSIVAAYVEDAHPSILKIQFSDKIRDAGHAQDDLTLTINKTDFTADSFQIDSSQTFGLWDFTDAMKYGDVLSASLTDVLGSHGIQTLDGRDFEKSSIHVVNKLTKPAAVDKTIFKDDFSTDTRSSWEIVNDAGKDVSSAVTYDAAQHLMKFSNTERYAFNRVLPHLTKSFKLSIDVDFAPTKMGDGILIVIYSKSKSEYVYITTSNNVLVIYRAVPTEEHILKNVNMPDNRYKMIFDVNQTDLILEVQDAAGKTEFKSSMIGKPLNAIEWNSIAIKFEAGISKFRDILITDTTP